MADKNVRVRAEELVIVKKDEFAVLDENPIDALDKKTYQRIEKLASWFVLRAPLSEITRLANPSLIDVFKSGDSPKRGSRTGNRAEFEKSFLVPLKIDCSRFEFVYIRKGVKANLEDKDLLLNDGTVFQSACGKVEERAVCFVGRNSDGSSEDSCIESVCRHIRNAFAHGRIAVKQIDGEPIVFLEDGGVPRNVEYEGNEKPGGQLLEVRFRMVVKLSTLESWYKTLVPDKE